MAPSDPFEHHLNVTETPPQKFNDKQFHPFKQILKLLTKKAVNKLSRRITVLDVMSGRKKLAYYHTGLEDAREVKSRTYPLEGSLYIIVRVQFEDFMTKS